MGVLNTFVGEPWEYQEADALRISERLKGRALLGHKTGLGKTFISLLTLFKRGPNRVLIVGTKSALSVWIDEVPKYTETEVVYLSRKDPCIRDKWQEALNIQGRGIWLINHDMFRRLMEETVEGGKQHIWFDAIVVDEAHKAKNRKSLLYKYLKKIKSRELLLLTATPASRGAQDMWSYLNLLDPDMFGSYWKYVNTFCWVVDGSYGKVVEGTKNKEALRALLKDYYVAHTYAEVKHELPPLRRQTVMVEMEEDQEKLYRKMCDTFLLETPEAVNGKPLLIAPGILAASQRLRQLALCPRVLDKSFPYGAGVDYIVEEICERPYDERHTVIFSISKEVLYRVREALEREGVQNIFMLQGGMEPDEVSTTVREFKKTKGIMLCTISFAQSFALDTVNIAYVLGADYDPSNNLQAEGRLRRGNSVMGPEGVLVKYIVISGTKEEDTRDIINVKVSTVKDFITGYAE